MTVIAQGPQGDPAGMFQQDGEGWVLATPLTCASSRREAQKQHLASLLSLTSSCGAQPLPGVLDCCTLSEVPASSSPLSEKTQAKEQGHSASGIHECAQVDMQVCL